MGIDINYKNELDRLLNENISRVIERERTSFDELVYPHGKSIVLFGAGNLGRKVLARLRKEDIEPLAFADNNKKLWGKDIDGVKVISPEDAAKNFGQQAAFIVTIWRPKSGHRFSETKQYLNSLNCNKVISIVPFFWKYSDTFLPEMYMDLPHKLIEHANDIRFAFNLLSDDESRKTFVTQLKWRIEPNFDGLPPRSSKTQYFPDEIFSLSNEEVFVDCGAFDGDTIKEFLMNCNKLFSNVIAFEPDPLNFQKLETYIMNLPIDIKERIISFQNAVGKEEIKLNFSCEGDGSSIQIEKSDFEVDCLKLDKIISDYLPTYIKMDIEGAEIDAIIGARKVIETMSPMLSVCVYHRQDHIWRIPSLIQSYSDKYKFFIRSHDEEGWELVCYAVPIKRLIKNL